MEVCSLDAVLVSATVHNRLQPFASDRGGRKLPCLWEKSHKVALSESFRCDVASFSVAGVSLCDMWTCDRRATVVAESHFCCVFCKNRIGRAARSGDQVQIPWQV